ncbi:hypothetical protein [Burkholderia vietnamiensis]|uniref:hypothetical protein n=1 Tax=Burkholderia vietnamiensis TaxID=60552 RepID=UPI000B296C89|nr:hypothetical protein [Burkholderia vietnamiensis]HDR9159018.1 hypothetical protein [Burkholderia vietnamiensis]
MAAKTAEGGNVGKRECRAVRTADIGGAIKPPIMRDAELAGRVATADTSRAARV